MKRRIKGFFSILLLILSGIMVALVLYIMGRFQHITFEQLLYSLFYSKGSSIHAVLEGIVVCIIIFVVYMGLVLFPFLGKVKIRDTVFFPIPRELFFSYSIYLFFLMFVASGLYFGLFKYVYYQIDTTDLFDYYVDPRSVDIQFNGEKKNLIYIFVESLEMSGVSSSNGGFFDKSIIPDLEKLALENTNFSNGSQLGGAVQVEGVGWTMAGMVSETAGVPLKVLVQGNHYNEYSSFLPGVYSLGEILSDNGYSNYLMMGSDADFGGRKQYFLEHGNYEIYDYYWAINQRMIDPNYYEWWGYEDSKLFSFAKDKLMEISHNDGNFNFTLLTADSHFPNGYIDKSCSNDLPFQSHYANSFYCVNKMLFEFVEWIKSQDFYQDTVIVISGDHLVMQGDIYQKIDAKDRTVYQTIIHSDLSSDNTSNRVFTTMDMFPTTLASIGATIDGDRLGLGTNLYSSKETLVEKLGVDYVNREIPKRSKFYNQYLLQDTYQEMYKNVGRKYYD